MLNRFIPPLLRMRKRFPRTYDRVVAIGKRLFGKQLGVYPRPMADEVGAVTSVLRGSRWNMTAGRGLAHERLEADFAAYLGVPYAIAVNTGGMALQMSMRALGLRPGDEVLHQVDTCSATALAVMAAGCTPIFADVDPRTFMLNESVAGRATGPRTKALLATHMWGNPENMSMITDLARRLDLPVIEDTCLSLGARAGGSMAGSLGKVGVFSFGCLKPIQGGEGGMIATSDEALARELRSMRHWGDRDIEYGVRDTLRPAWNGRLSELVAAVVTEQLKGYPGHLLELRQSVERFRHFLGRFDGLELVLGSADSVNDCAFTQAVLRIDEHALGMTKTAFKDGLYARGVPVWHANFELITSLSLFRGEEWRNWMPAADIGRVQANYAADYPVANQLLTSNGIGLGKMNFLSPSNLQHLMAQIETICRKPDRP